jgi:hypothetical protein
MNADIPQDTTPLPILSLDILGGWEWPWPPFARLSRMPPPNDDLKPCRVEKLDGVIVDGYLAHFDSQAGVLHLRPDPGGEPVQLPFGSFRRVGLTTPWPRARVSANAPAEYLPSDAQEREYRIDLVAGSHLAGRTLGHVREAYGLFLFVPIDNGAAVRRVFVPQAACAAVHFEPSAEERAAERWVATPAELFKALAAQQHAPVQPLGDAIVDLGHISREVLDRFISQHKPAQDQPLGEALVAAGLLARADLQTALAHKMGYPLVDLARFPVDEHAARKLSRKSMIEHNAFPLIQDGDRLIVAVDDLARVPRLQALQALAGLKVVPVLASRGRLAMALAALTQLLSTDRWADFVPTKPHAVATSPAPLRDD